MLELKDLSFRYANNKPLVLDGIDLTLPSGEIGVLLGRNGAGKTTLFKTVLGLVRPTGGTVTLDGEDLTRLSPREKAHRIAYVPQQIAFGNLTVFETVLTGRISYFGFTAGKEDEETVRQVLEELGLAPLADRSAEELSGGEMQKVAIARALVQNPRLLVLDEPTGNLDLANEQLILKEMRRLASERGISVLTALHDLNQALSLGDRFFLMKGGKVLFSGGPDILTEDRIESVFGIRVRIIEHEGRKLVLQEG
ncbi:MAG: ABC transporter ATP-binding protein [Lachnospiraceae bacterium]|nr:ABC transporter ATP-binding protein [Lachnospiraceae bacterium]